MGNDLPKVHRQALSSTRRILAGVRTDQWAAPTPCPEWDVRALTNHIVAGNWWAAELAGGRTIADVGDRLDGDVLGDNAVDEYDLSAAAAMAAFERPGAMETPCAVSYGPVPGAVYCGHRIIDVLIHGWDLARATGQSADLDPELVDASLEIVRPQADLLVSSGAFAGGVAADAEGPQAELLALLGRRG